MQWNDVFGYFVDPTLYDRLVAEAPAGSTIVEVGVLCGRSLIYLAEKAKAADKGLQIVGVDWGLGTATNGDGVGPTASKLAMNLRDCHSDAIVVLSESVNATRLFGDDSLYAVYIDANHSYESVKADIEAWYPKVERGGVLAGDDYNWDGVKQAVDERFGNAVEIIGNSWVFRKVWKI